MDEFDEESDKSHDAETDSSGHCNFLKFLAVRFRATLHESKGILGELTPGFNVRHDLIHGSVWFSSCNTKISL